MRPSCSACGVRLYEKDSITTGRCVSCETSAHALERMMMTREYRCERCWMVFSDEAVSSGFISKVPCEAVKRCCEYGETCLVCGPSNRFSGTMQAMSNVMACVVSAQNQVMFLLRDFELAQRNDHPAKERWGEDFNLASREWSAEVRRKVKAMKPGGPVVSCQGEED